MDPGDAQRREWWKAALAILTLFAALAAIPVAPFAAYLGYEFVSRSLFFTRTPFVADLGGPLIDDQARHFAERVEQAFPIGTRVDVLRDTLLGQGFSALPPYGGFESRLHVEHASFPCRVDWNIVWSARDGAVSVARGDMMTTCL